MSTRVTADDVRAALRRHYGISGSDLFAEEWALLDELALKTRGWTVARIDCLAVRCWSGQPKGHERVAIEIKADRADFRREMLSEKWRVWQRIVHRFAFVVPDGLVTAEDVPPECGLGYVTDRGVRWVRPAPLREPEPLPDSVVAEVCRRLSRHEERLRQAVPEDPAVEIAALRLEVKRLTARALAADARIERHRRRVVQLMQDLGADARCACGRPVRYHRGLHQWLHADDGARFCSGDEGARRWGDWARPADETADDVAATP